MDVTGSNGNVSTAIRNISNAGYPNTIVKSLYRFWKDGEYCDITLHVGGRTIKTHKTILATLSEYFRILLRMDAQNETDVHLHGVSFSCLELLLQYAYTGSLEVKDDEVQSLYITADYLQVHYVKEACERMILRSVNKGNCVSMLSFALTFSLEKITNRCLTLMGRHLEEISQSEEFVSIPYDCLLSFVSKVDLIVFRNGYPLPLKLNELAILKAIMRYVSEPIEPKLNKDQIYSLVIAAKLIYVDYDEWEKMVENHTEMLMDDSFCDIRKYLEEAKDTANKVLMMSILNTPPSWSAEREDPVNTKIVHRECEMHRSSFDYLDCVYFDDQPSSIVNEGNRISKIVVVTGPEGECTEEVVTGVHVFDSHWRHHGYPLDKAEPSKCHEIELKTTEVIIRVEMMFLAGYINTMTFFTNLKRSLGPFGGKPVGSQLGIGFPPENYLGYLHSFAGYECEDSGSKCIRGLDFNWVCHRDLDHHNSLSEFDMEWERLEIADDEKSDDEEYFETYMGSGSGSPGWSYPYSDEEDDEEEAEEEDDDEGDDPDA